MEEVAGKERLLDRFSRVDKRDWAVVKHIAKVDTNDLGHSQYEINEVPIQVA